MAIISYTMGNTNGFTYGDTTKVTAGVSNSATLGTTNSLTIGTSSSFSLAGTLAASIGGSASLSYTGALSVSYGKTVTYSLTSTTQARDTITLKGGSGPDALVGWGFADSVLTEIKVWLAALTVVNAGLAAGAIVTSPSSKAKSSIQSFDDSKKTWKTAVSLSTATIGANVLAAVVIGVAVKKLADLLGAIKQVGNLVLDATGANLTADFTPDPWVAPATASPPIKSALQLGLASASLSKVDLAATRSLTLDESSTSLAFGTTVTPEVSSQLVLNAAQAKLTGGNAVAGGPSLTISGATPPAIKGTLTAEGVTDYFQLGTGTFFVTAGDSTKGTMALNSLGSSLLFQSAEGQSGVGATNNGVYVTSGVCKINAGPSGVSVEGNLVRLG